MKSILDLYVPFCYFADYQHTQHTLVVQLQPRQAQTLLTSYPGWARSQATNFVVVVKEIYTYKTVYSAIPQYTPYSVFLVTQ